MKLLFRECGLEDLPVLQLTSHNTFNETFAHMNTPSTMEAYLKHAFSPEKLGKELAVKDSVFYFLYADGQLSGYLKLNEGNAQTDIFDPEALEIERIYVKKEFQGLGLGGALMDNALRIARTRGKTYAWLGVWEKNQKAIAFYKKHGFYIAGTHSFFMGDEEQNDYVMRKDLRE
jgi:ribosomal protein S18 acetylase RimI-like enzyme